MEEKMNVDEQVEDEKTVMATQRSTWARKYISGTVYLWACGETEDETEDLMLSDRFIGWLVLILQALVYSWLLFGKLSSSGTDSTPPSVTTSTEFGGVDPAYSMVSIVGAMYLLVATTLPDLRAGFSLSVDGKCASHRVFGVALLVVYGLMISASMEVLMSSSEGDEAVVTNAVLVLFVANLDEQAYTFFSTVPKKWRLFWAIYSVSFSYALALVTIVYFGEASKLQEYGNFLYSRGALFGGAYLQLDDYPSWFFLVVSPGATALCSIALSNALPNFLESCSEACENIDNVTVCVIIAKGFTSFFETMTRAKQRLRGDPCFYAFRMLWLVQGVLSWCFLPLHYGFPVAFNIPYSDGDDPNNSVAQPTFTENRSALIIANIVLVAGLAAKAFCFVLQRQECATDIPEQQYSSNRSAGRASGETCGGSRVSSLLVGCGIGYWATSLLYVLGGAWHGGGWDDPPLAVRIVAYVTIPCFFIFVIFTMADADFLGERLRMFIAPAIAVVTNDRTILHWVLKTIIRDVLLLWVLLSLMILIYLS